MFQRSIYLGLLLAAIASQTASHPSRVARSPDSTMEVNVPDNSADYEYDPDNEYNQQAKDEEQYWENEGKTMEEGGNGDDADRLEEEKEFQEDQDEQYVNEGNSTMTDNRENAEQHQDDNNEHYSNGDDDYELNTDGEKVNRYEEKGESGMNGTRDKMESYDADGKSPSISYNNQ